MNCTNFYLKPLRKTLFIDKRTSELEEVCMSLVLETRIIEFRTFVRENVGINVHLHKFEPLISLESQKVEKELVKPNETKSEKEWTEEELEEFITKLTIKEKALLYVCANEADPKDKNTVLSKMNELLKRKGEKIVDEVGFTGVKSGITRKTRGKDYILPSQFDVDDYFKKEFIRYQINPKYKDTDKNFTT